MPAVRARVPIVLGRTGGRPAELATFTGLADEHEHLACVWGPLSSLPVVRIHSECLTGDVLGSLRCDCGPQLDEALGILSREGGVLLYLRQEGRGIGLYRKLDTYLLQDGGVDTFTANRMLGRGEDERDYTVAAQMLAALGVGAVELITNNPAKVDGLRRAGIQVAGRRPTRVYANPHNAAYLRAKRELGHHALNGVVSKLAREESP
jgi:GTP cyclohydrolase II